MSLCECGCGQPTKIARQTRTQWGHVKGQPVRFISGHNQNNGLHDLRDRILAWSKRTPNGCREWQGHLNNRGYGFTYANGRQQLAHRVAYEVFRGPIPDGLVIDHLVCDNPACVDHWHLEPTTGVQNVMRGNGVGARNARKTHCPQGHPYDEANTYRSPRGVRICRTCARDRRAAKRSAA